MSKYKTLVIFSDRFPFGAESERVFLKPELEAASGLFERVIVVPTGGGGEADEMILPKNVEIDRFWVDSAFGKHRFLRALACLNPKVISKSRGDVNRKGITFGVSARLAAGRLRKWIKERRLDVETTLFHTFWFDIMAGAMSLLCAKMPLHWVSSAHGFDIYTKKGGKLREEMVERVGAIYCASESGAEFMRGRYKPHAQKINSRILGSPAVGKSEAHSKDERKLTFLSVSNVIDLKRVNLNAELLIALAKGRTERHIHWIHAGDGPLLNRLRLMLEREILPDNFSYELRGQLSNEAVMKIYEEEKVDWLMLLSRYEGGNPIAVCEALSHGVPVIATDTTGLAEAVNDDCAVLLPLNPRSEEFVRGMLPYLESEPRYEAMREAARKRWTEKFDSGKLRREFYKHLQGDE